MDLDIDISRESSRTQFREIAPCALGEHKDGAIIARIPLEKNESAQDNAKYFSPACLLNRCICHIILASWRPSPCWCPTFFYESVEAKMPDWHAAAFASFVSVLRL